MYIYISIYICIYIYIHVYTKFMWYTSGNTDPSGIINTKLLSVMFVAVGANHKWDKILKNSR